MSLRARLKRSGRALLSPFALWTAATLLAALFVWFIGPLIALGEFRPLASLTARLSILLLLVLVWGVISVLAERRRAGMDQSLLQALRRQDEEAAAATEQDAQRVTTEIRSITTRIDRALAPLRRASRFWSRLRSEPLPWLLLIGPPGAGKTTALLSAGLTLPFPVQADAGTPTASCDAIVTDRAVFIDMAGRYTVQDAEPKFDAAVWIGMLDWLRKRRPRQPLNGVVLTVSATALAAMAAEERQAFAQVIRRRLDELGERLSTRVPIYVLLSKLDLVPGFAETFEVLSAEEAAQVWGTPLSPLDSAAGGTQPFSAGFAELVRSVGRRQIKRLQDGPDEHSRALIFDFPNQLAALEGGLAHFLEVIGGAHQFAPAPLLRGIALTSARQDQPTVDLLAAPMQRAFAALQRAATPKGAAARSRPFFLRTFLQTLLAAETRAAGLSRPAFVSAQIRRRAAAVLLGTTLVGGLLLFGFSYRDSDMYLTRVMAATNQAKVRLDGYGLAGRALPPFSQTLSILDSLRTLSITSEDLTSGRVFQVSEIEDHAHAAYQRGLHNLLVPYVVRSLEAAVANRNVPPASRFQQLKLYLMLGGERTVEPALLNGLAPFFAATLLVREDSPAAASSLQAHLAALGQNPPPPSTVDAARIAEARRLIAEVTLAKIAYDLVRDEVAARNLPPWRPGDSMSSAGVRALALASGASLWEGVSALYTRTGYVSTLPPLARSMSDALAADAWVLGPPDRLQLQESARIMAGVFDLYRSDYIRIWDSLLSDLSAVPLQSPPQAAEVLSILIGSPSPLKQLLEAIAEQTNLEPAVPGGLAGAAAAAAANPVLRAGTALARDPISAHFAAMRNAVRAAEGKESQVDGVFKIVEALYRQLNHLATGGDIIELGTEPQSVLNQANDLIARLPPSLQPVFTRIRKEASAVAEERSRDRLKTIWTSTVLPYCQALTRRKFPFDPSAAQDVTIGDFVRLFGPDGAIAGFRKMYLKAFLDTSERPWRWRVGRNMDIRLSDDILAQFEHADAITNAFFEGDKPSVRFTIEFASLDRRAMTVQLDVGGPVAGYAHGPATPVAAQWPTAADTAPVALSVTPEVAGSTNSIFAEGPWALFRVMQRGTVKIAGAVTTARFVLGGRPTTLVLRTANAGQPFDAALLTGFRCPVL